MYQLGTVFGGGGFNVGTVIAILLVLFIVYMLFRKNKYNENQLTIKEKVLES